MRVALGALAALLVVAAYAADQRDYVHKERVAVAVNNVGPFNNPAEVYPYYDLPFCSPKHTHSQGENLGETLAGDRRRNSLYDIRFRVDVQWQALCHFRMSQDDIQKFSEAIKEHYIFEMFLDELPIKGFVGEVEQTSMRFDSHVHNESHVYLFTHLDFSIAYNGPNIIAVNLTTDPQQRIELELGKEIDVEFSYSVSWSETTTKWMDRMQIYQMLMANDQMTEIHWLSIINTFVLVVLLTAFLGMILMRVLKKDISRYMALDDVEDGSPEDQAEEGGWKLVHGDVFRPPPSAMLFSACIGTGAQILVLVVTLLMLAVLGTFYQGNRGALYSAAIVLYALTSGIAGYVATTIYIQLGGQKWATNAVLTACLFTIPFFCVFLFVNSVAWSYGSSSALPFATIFVIFCLWALVTFPLTVFGSLRARNKGALFDAPCKTNRVEREIPPVAWYRTAPVQMFVAGFLPFSAIYIELHYIFASIYGHRVYTLFGILALSFIMLLVVTAFITVALTYFQLAAEDYRWWWRAFASGCATGVFMYAYAIFYYVYRSEMNGMLQASFFFGYVFMVSYAFSLMLGAVSYWMAQKFVRYIYARIHVD